ncbi:Txe/YoeB family addiction module toxin [Salinicoccus halodurans]|uniref:Endoribonuclease YoeB n=1 Tax=Salinicoccus halodurans TaxID=407035 RepID=A0ABN4FZ45_9STAP|nr:Txe/YoeB family addiction module toxin [Salinicoccus halodurans]AKG73517.1 addiction module protein [Salinicoccus halodurans]
MSNYRIVIKNSAKSDLKKIKHSNLKSQFEDVIDVLKENPYYPNQSFEKLQPKNQGRYSRRINQQHRVVYKVDDSLKQVEIYSAWSHYE